jgi:hypothetical protein
MISTEPKKSKSLMTFTLLLLALVASILIIAFNGYNKPKPAVDNTNNNQQTNTTNQELQPTIPGWKVYENKEYGFRVDYPSNWTAKETGSYTAMSLVSPETQKDFEDNLEQIKDFYVGNFNEYFAYNSDVSVYRYSSLEDKYGVKSIKELTEINTGIVSNVSKIKIHNIDATEFIQHGETIKYTIIFENNGYFYEIVLNRVGSKDGISDTLKQIISSFQLIK